MESSKVGEVGCVQNLSSHLQIHQHDGFRFYERVSGSRKSGREKITTVEIVICDMEKVVGLGDVFEEEGLDFVLTHHHAKCKLLMFEGSSAVKIVLPFHTI